MSLLEVTDLSCGYGDTRVVFDVSFSVGSGDCLGIIGPNGHGKTTMLRAISGLIPAWGGSVRFEGLEIAGRSPHSISRMGLAHVPQGDMIFPDLTVEDNLFAALHGAGRWGERRRGLSEVYAVFPRLQERRKQLSMTLSGGEKRMLALGRGLVLDAKLLMIDEPSLGLAPRVIQEVYERICHMREHGVAMIIVDESPARLDGVADRLCLIDTGRVIEAGPTAVMLQHEKVLETYLGFSAAESEMDQ